MNICACLRAHLGGNMVIRYPVVAVTVPLLPLKNFHVFI